MNQVALISTTGTKKETLSDTKLKITVNGMTVEVPIEAELYSCEVESLKFDADKIKEEYLVGNGPVEITLP